MKDSYELLDSGEGEKLEHFGDFILRRPDPQALWKKSLKPEAWIKADATFDTKWKKSKEIPESWNITLNNLTFKISLASFKHTGVFPEHKTNWQWLEERAGLTEGKKVLNLFGYTGGASLAAAKTGAEVVHVDASKLSVAKAKENAVLSSLEQAKIRYIVDDADLFLRREITRGNSYDGIILDPPSFGRGAKGEVWRLEEGLIPLLEKCKQVLSPTGFILLNGYAEGYTKESYAQLLSSVFDVPLLKVEAGNLFLKENSERGFILSAGIFARFINS